MEKSMTVNGQMILHVEKESILTQMELNMKVIGLMIINMATDLKLGQMVLDIKENINLGKKMDKVSQHLLMVPIMKEILLIMKFQDTEFINGQMDEYIQDNGKIINCTGKEISDGQMEGVSKEVMKMTKSKGYGIFYFGDGRKYIGTWNDGKQNGLGIYYQDERHYKIGEWQNGQRQHWLNDQEIEAIKESISQLQRL
ncbi:unnamed protein product (macronuclear) [Paramecium tetraurelia]|uniref:MORN repeat protein n=1 Tax=Paramecium tetraurelia TaxID=5888 RepID=A0C7X9_PARTE|nr:uncharacterized protein GSPATT00036027001 [Paramecium tetraurelia]CAK66896.1 unnamed protein product [Paramecium tetraurelia]|eukprot:XP_001434293.1 hypothetical protein (macronuclear) [Paramecium tetraurelia strain d4-2]